MVRENVNRKMTIGEAWNHTVEKVIEISNGLFTLNPKTGDLVPLSGGNVKSGPGLREGLAAYVQQAKEIIEANFGEPVE